VRREWNGGLFDGTVRSLGFSAASQALWAVTSSSVNSYTMPKDIPTESCGESACWRGRAVGAASGRAQGDSLTRLALEEWRW
jgi:hypothetical protein